MRRMRESEQRYNEMVVGLMEDQSTSLQSIPEFPPYPATQSNAQPHLHIDILKRIMSEMSEEERSISAQIVKYREFGGNEGEKQEISCVIVMDHLRSSGLDAAICKSEPKHGRSFPPGIYEFMDVLVRKKGEKSRRILVDMDFRTQFEIARPSSDYSALLQLLPLIFVGNSEKLVKIVKIMSKSAKISMKREGMYIPPWRTYAYMHSKWLGFCRRITTHFPEQMMSESSEGREKNRESWKWSVELSEKSSNQRMGKMPIVLMRAGLSSMFKVVAVA